MLLNLLSSIPAGRGSQSGIDRYRTGPWAAPCWRTRPCRMAGSVLQTGRRRVVTLCRIPIEHLISLASAWDRIDGLGVNIPFEREYEAKQGWFPGWSFTALRRISVGLERDPNLGQVQAQADAWLNIYRQLECPASRALAYRGLARYCIPILRGMRPPELAADSRFQAQARLDCFAERTVNDYFPSIVSNDTVRPQLEAEFIGLDHGHADHLVGGVGVEGRQGRLQRRFPVPIAPLWRAWPRRAPCPAPL